MVASSAPKNNFLRVRKIRFFRTSKRQKSRQGTFGAMKKRFLSDSEIWLFLGAKNVRNRVKIVLVLRQSEFFRIWKIHFLCAPKHKKSRQGCFAAMKKKFLSDSEKSLFQSVITQKITSRLLCAKKKRIHSVSENSLFEDDKRRIFHEVCFGAMKSDQFQIPNIRFLRGKKAGYRVKDVLALRKSGFFRIRKIRFFRDPTLEIPSKLFSRHEIAIFFRLRIFAFSERQNTDNYYKFLLAPLRIELFRIRKIRVFRDPKGQKPRHGCFGSMKSDFLRIRIIRFFSALKRYKSRQVCLGTMKRPFLPDQENSLLQSVVTLKIASR